MKRAALLARVSTENQKDEATIESQIAEIKSKIIEDNNTLVGDCVYVDEGYSGELLARPALDRLRDDSRNGLFEILYVYDRGRLARKFAYQELIIEELTDLGIDFVTIHDVQAVTPEEKVLQSMQGVFHEYERVKITERFRRGKLFKVRQGKLLGYNPPYGYDYTLKTKTRNGFFTINQNEARVVRMIFEWVGNEGIALREVIRRLYDRKIPPRKGKRNTWTKGPIARMLRNETYFGDHFYLKTEAVISRKPRNNGYHRVKKTSRINRPREEWLKVKVPSIIGKPLFVKVQEQLELNKIFAPRNAKREYLVGGLIYCSCNQRRTGEGIKDHLYYRCTDRLHRFPLPSQCHEGGVNVKVVDTLVWNRIFQLMTDKDELKELSESWLNHESAPKEKAINQSNEVEKENILLKQEEERYTIAFGKGIMPIEIYEGRMSDIARQKAELTQRLVPTKPKINILNLLSPSALAKATIDTVQLFDFSDKKHMIRQLIEKVTATKEMVVVAGHIPVSINSHVELSHEARHSWIA